VVKQHVARTYRDGPDGNTPIVASGLNDDQDTLAKLSTAVGDLQDGTTNGPRGTAVSFYTGTTAERAAVTPAIGTLYWNTTTNTLQSGWDHPVARPRRHRGHRLRRRERPHQRPRHRQQRQQHRRRRRPGHHRHHPHLQPVRDCGRHAARHRPVHAVEPPHPGGTGTYNYWWTATVDGVEGARSNIAYRVPAVRHHPHPRRRRAAARSTPRRRSCASATRAGIGRSTSGIRPATRRRTCRWSRTAGRTPPTSCLSSRTRVCSSGCR
jgi:hypothetical protein